MRRRKTGEPASRSPLSFLLSSSGHLRQRRQQPEPRAAPFLVEQEVDK